MGALEQRPALRQYSEDCFLDSEASGNPLPIAVSAREEPQRGCRPCKLNGNRRVWRGQGSALSATLSLSHWPVRTMSLERVLIP